MTTLIPESMLVPDRTIATIDDLPTSYRLDIEPLRQAPRQMYSATEDVWEDCPHVQGAGWQQTLVLVTPVPRSLRLLRALLVAQGDTLQAVWSSVQTACLYLQGEWAWYMALSGLERVQDPDRWVVTLTLALIEECA